MQQWLKRRRDKRQKAKNRPRQDFQDLLYNMTFNPKDTAKDDSQDEP